MGGHKMARVFEQAFDTGTSSVTYNLDPVDLSTALFCVITIILTKADTGAGDILDISFQERFDEVTWNRRVRFPNFLGTLSPTATAPETYKMTLSAKQALTLSEEAHEPDGSAGATALTTDKVQHGPLRQPLRTSSGLLTAHRVVLTVTNATAADFEGQILIDCAFPL